MKQGDKTRAHIVDAANVLFYHQGYARTSFGDIYARTGLSKGNITYHYKTKQALLEEVIIKRMTDIGRLLDSWEEATKNPAERLARFCEMLVTEQDNLRRFGCPMGTLTAELTKTEPTLHRIALAMFECFRGWLARQFGLLGYTPEEADEQAMGLLARVQGIAMMTHVFDDARFLHREIRELKEVILRAQSNGDAPASRPRCAPPAR